MSGAVQKYKVLWVDDHAEGEFLASYQIIASDYNLYLEGRTNWIDAEKELRKHFDQYSAIILDAFCPVTPGTPEETTFITIVLPSLLSLFQERKQVIPWFILSAGTMDMFEFVIKTAQHHHDKYEEWGQMLYKKEVPDDDPQNSEKLFQKIEILAKDQSNNVVLCRHEDVFKYLGNDKLIQGEARSILRKMLSVLYFPAESPHDIIFEGNPLRKVMEYVFRAAHRIGLLPDESIDKDNKVNLLESNRYMSGINTRYSKLRYGNAGESYDGKGGDTIFPEYLGHITRAIIEFGSVDSHTNEAFPYTIDDKDLSLTENEKELFFSYVLQLCHVIKFFGNFADSHNDVKVNRSMIKSISVLDPSECEGSEGVVETDGANHYCDKCVLADSAKRYIGKRVKLFNVKLNYRETKDKYPFFARYEVLDK